MRRLVSSSAHSVQKTDWFLQRALRHFGRRLDENAKSATDFLRSFESVMPRPASAYQFPHYSKEALRAKPRSTQLGAWRVESLSFCAPGNEAKPPVLFLGGAFQNYWSFRIEVERLIAEWPIILVHLPGQGANVQPSGELTLDDFADLLAAFLDEEGIEKVSLIGLSYGSMLAHRFGVRHAGRLEGVVVGVTSERVPECLRRGLQFGFKLLDRGELDAWSSACVLAMVNFHHADATGFSLELAAKFKASILALDEAARERWRDNSRRLFREGIEGMCMARTLVFGCRHDHFLPPHLAAGVARTCRNSTFAIIDRADHLVPLERPRELLATYVAFLRREPLPKDGIFEGEHARRLVSERRTSERFRIDGEPVNGTDEDGNVWHGRLLGLSAHGAHVDVVSPLREDPRPRTLCIPGWNIRTQALHFAEQGSLMRLVFAHSDFQQAGALFARVKSMRTARNDQRL